MKLTFLPENVRAEVLGIIQGFVIGALAVTVVLVLVFNMLGNVAAGFLTTPANFNNATTSNVGNFSQTYGYNATNVIQASLYNNGVLNIGLLIIAVFFGVILLVVRSFGGNGGASSFNGRY